ncbi:MAG: (d)CMP kinase [Thermodesulfovibrionales bacterium]|nr:(d)CMP kinase [Thermodesulfovibrionales bacterium]
MRDVIAIDGPSGSGKTTVAKSIAEEIGYRYLDTGALYRTVAFALRKNMVDSEDSDERLAEVLGQNSIMFKDGKVFLNGVDVSDTIRSTEIDHYSSVFSARKVVRDFLLDAQRDAARHNNLVAEGRDTTTVVFPGAQIKIFLNASVEERAKRRYLQYRGKGITISMDEAKKSIIDRDTRDAGRDISPLTISSDALVIDSSVLSIEQVKERILDYLKKGSSAGLRK